MGPCGLVTCCPDGSPSNAMIARPVTGRALCEHVRPGRKTPDAGQEQPAGRRAAVDIAQQIGIDGGAWGTRVGRGCASSGYPPRPSPGPRPPERHRPAPGRIPVRSGKGRLASVPHAHRRPMPPERQRTRQLAMTTGTDRPGSRAAPDPACRESNVLLHDHRRAPGPAGCRPETVGKDVAKSAFLTIGPGPFVSQSRGVTVPPRR